jgi:hypothetical protein
VTVSIVHNMQVWVTTAPNNCCFFARRCLVTALKKKFVFRFLPLSSRRLTTNHRPVCLVNCYFASRTILGSQTLGADDHVLLLRLFQLLNGTHRDRLLHHFNYCSVRPLQRNVYTEPLLCNDLLLWQHYFNFQTLCCKHGCYRWVSVGALILARPI